WSSEAGPRGPPAGAGCPAALPSNPSARGLPLLAEDAVQRVGGVVDQRLGVVRERVKVLERQVAAVADAVQRLQHRRPVGRAVQQRAERLQRVVGALLAELLEVDVLDPFAEDANPIFWKLEQHDVARVEVDADVLAVET